MRRSRRNSSDQASSPVPPNVSNRDHYFVQSSHTRRRRTHSKNNHGHNHAHSLHRHPQQQPQDLHNPYPARAFGNTSVNLNGNVGIASRQHRMNEPTFSTTVSDLMYIITGYTSRFLSYLQQCAPRFFRNLALVVLLVATVFATMMAVIILRFIHLEGRPLCTPPPTYLQQQQELLNQTTPLVEYYVHGRGNGHYARSVAIVESLLSKGIDVRMFIGRATMWRAVNEAHAGGSGETSQSSASSLAQDGTKMDNLEDGTKMKMDNLDQHPPQSPSQSQPKSKRGQVTVTSVASLLPSMSFLDSISLLIERGMSDCEVAKQTNRYPTLVISDGDLPGMWRAKVGSIPMVSISHGQTFVIGHIPEWVSSDPALSKAWYKQRTLNARTSQDANWLIGTNFVDIPVNGGNGVVARSPMRPEVIRMGKQRQIRKRQLEYMNLEGDVLNPRGGGRSKGGLPLSVTGNDSMEAWQRDVLRSLLFGKDVDEALRVVKRAVESKQIEPFSGTHLSLTRRKLVICYFRDKNGDLLTNALLRSGFDVLLFERGYHKGLSDEDGEKKFGQNLMVHREPARHVSEDEEDLPLKDYWVDILSKNDRKLLEDDDFEEDPEAEAGASDNRTNDTGNDNRGREESNAKDSIKSDAQTLQNALEMLNNLFKSGVAAPRIIRVTDMSLFVPLLSIADGVASSAGSQLLSECIYSHLNLLALHREDDSEQMLNIAFSRHRFDRLSKESPPQQAGSLSGENIDYYGKENVVHGMSQEKFADVFETISRHKEASDEFETILSKAEEKMLLRTPESVKTYADFKAYVEAVRQSPISWSYYHDLFFEIMDQSNQNNAVGGEVQSDAAEEEDSITKYIDPFQGMPEAASIIAQIIDDLTKKKSSK